MQGLLKPTEHSCEYLGFFAPFGFFCKPLMVFAPTVKASSSSSVDGIKQVGSRKIEGCKIIAN